MAKTIQRLDGFRLGLAGGIVVAFGVFFVTAIAAGTGYGAETLDMFHFYPGYSISAAGSAVGFLWGFVDGFIGFGFIGWLYNHIHLKNDR